MVRTLTNAFATGRIAHAFMLTGVRGVGKTTTARMLARALNYELADGSIHEPTLDVASIGVHCRPSSRAAIPDVIEIDAFSRRRSRDVRADRRCALRTDERPLQGLHHRRSALPSNQAFDAFLQTLEEPLRTPSSSSHHRRPAQGPVTILSRCNDFDLRRVDADLTRAEPGRHPPRRGAHRAEGLALIARARGRLGPRRLSLLDQAIASAAAWCAARMCGRCSALPTRAPPHRYLPGGDAGRSRARPCGTARAI